MRKLLDEVEWRFSGSALFLVFMNEEFLIMKFYSHQVRSDSIFRIIFLFKTTRKLSQTSAAITNEQQLR